MTATPDAVGLGALPLLGFLLARLWRGWRRRWYWRPALGVRRSDGAAHRVGVLPRLVRAALQVAVVAVVSVSVTAGRVLAPGAAVLEGHVARQVLDIVLVERDPAKVRLLAGVHRVIVDAAVVPRSAAAARGNLTS